MLGALALACACGGCGSGGSSRVGGDAGVTITDTAAVAPVRAQCATAALEALEQVGHSVYEESASGRIVAEAVYRLHTSQALAEAVAQDDAAAAHRVLEGLLLNQIVSVRVVRAGRTLTQIEKGSVGIAPASGSLLLDGQPVGTFMVAVQGANGYAQTTSGLTATQVLVRSGGRVLRSTLQPAPGALGAEALGTGALRAGQRELLYGGVRYRVDTFAGRAFPDRPMSISLLVPSASIAAICASGTATLADPAQARADTWGLVAERVYYAEHAGSKAELIRRYIERARAFRTAVLAGNAKATRAAIIGFFRSHLHIVRVRVIRAGRLLIDVGGPHVLGPIAGVIRNARGQVAAHFLFGIQDDLGFTILARAFTGAQTLMREGTRQVMGTLAPGPAKIPNRGRMTYRGKTYEAYSFDAEAFPSGTLRISLLYPAS
jgi:hypothetical protein